MLTSLISAYNRCFSFQYKVNITALVREFLNIISELEEISQDTISATKTIYSRKVRNFLKVNQIDKNLMKFGGHKVRNVVMITTKFRPTVRMEITITRYVRNSDRKKWLIESRLLLAKQ